MVYIPSSTDDLIRASAEKCVKENTWDEIEFLFKPRTAFELLLRMDFEGTRQLAVDWVLDDSPTAMPYRFRDPFHTQMVNLVKTELLYRYAKEITFGEESPVVK